MASNNSVRNRVRAFVAEVLAERVDPEQEHIDQIETEMAELGDAVAQEFATQLLARYGGRSAEASACPHCRRTLQQVGERKRKILTTRGPVPLNETRCYCPACRRHFFPSLGAVGAGSDV